MRKNHLILFTTRYINFDNESGGEIYLLDKQDNNRVEYYPNTKQVNLKKFKESKLREGNALGIGEPYFGQLLSAEHQTIWGHHALSYKPFLIDSHDFLAAYLSDVWVKLGEDKSNIKDIYFFVHRTEITDDKVTLEYYPPNKSKNLSNKETKVITTVQEVLPEGINLHFIAYKHGGELVDSFLTNKAITSEEIIKITSSVFELSEDENKKINEIKKPIEIKGYLFHYNLKAGKLDISHKIKFTDGDNTEQKVNIRYCTIHQMNSFKDSTDGIIQESKEEAYIPTIFITVFNLFKKRQLSYSDAPTLDDKIIYLDLDQRRAFFDSSIWFRAVSIEENQWGEDFETQIKQVLDDIKWAYQHDLYNKNSTKEHRDLHLRLYYQSYLKDFGSHASAVVPFKFHSETEQRHKAINISKRFEDIQWDFLLIDDFAKHEMRPSINKSASIKSEIIKEVINRDSLLPDKGENYTAGFETQSSLKNEGQCTVSKRADIILLDYLFSQETNKNGGLTEKQNPEYGTSLIQALKENPTLCSKFRGIYEMFWIFPVTVFPDAFASDMQNRQLPYIREHYYVSRGADPIDTPYLFRAGLFNFMALQIEKSDYSIKDVFDFVLGDAPIQNDSKKVKAWSIRAFEGFIERFGYPNMLQQSNDPTSLSRTLLKRLNITEIQGEKKDSLRLTDSFRNMLYHIAYLDGYMQSKGAALKEYKQIRAMFVEFYPKKQNEKENDKGTTIMEQIQLIGQYLFAPNNNYKD